MLELLAGSGNYIAILILCASCWYAGRSFGITAHSEEVSQGWTAKSLFDVREYVLLRADPAAKDASKDPSKDDLREASMPGAARDTSEVQPQPVDRGACRVTTADQIHDLIVNGDLSQEGVIESLVAMAEDQVRLDEVAHRDWRLPAASQKATSPFPEARILTRSAMVSEPLPADLVDPLTPEVLSRYRMYAQECNWERAE